MTDVFGVGILLLGRSGIGKSECVLELVSRGHRLVSDDRVMLREGDGDTLLGSAPPNIRHYVEIRGLGILFIPDLFGPDAVRDEMPVDLVCRLEAWDEGREYDRVGIVRATEDVGGRRLPSVTLPARPAGSMATIVEVAARDHRKRGQGIVAAVRLDEGIRRERGR